MFKIVTKSGRSATSVFGFQWLFFAEAMNIQIMPSENFEVFISQNPRGWKTKAWACSILGALQKKKLISANSSIFLSVCFLSPQKMKNLNKQARGKNQVTDVLSFEQLDTRIKPKNHLMLGDLVICPEVIRKQAKLYGNLVEQELVVILTHGLLHLLGHDHEKSPRKAAEMWKLEKSILSLVLKGTNKTCSGLIARSYSK